MIPNAYIQAWSAKAPWPDAKLRALLQRRKNRDLFDLHHGLDQLAMDLDKLIACFDHS